MKTNHVQSISKKLWLWLPMLSLAAMLVLTGCIASVYPLYHEKNLTFNPDLLGFWAEKPGDKDGWEFSKRDDNGYNLKIHDDGKTSRLICRLVKIEDKLFLDLMMNGENLKDAQIDPWTLSTIIPGHLILKVESISPLKIALLKRDWVEDQIKKDPKILAHTSLDKDKDFIIAATTDDLQKFVLKHWSTKDAWEQMEMQKRP